MTEILNVRDVNSQCGHNFEAASLGQFCFIDCVSIGYCFQTTPLKQPQSLKDMRSQGITIASLNVSSKALE